MRNAFDPDPLLGCRFVVEDDSNGVVAAFSQFSGIRMEVQTLANRYGSDSKGYQEYIPVMSRVAPITLSRGVIGDTSFLDWIFSCTAGLREDDHYGEDRRDLMLVALDERGMRKMAWLLRDAMPIGYELSSMSADASQVLTESVTIQVTRVQRINEGGYREADRFWNHPEGG